MSDLFLCPGCGSTKERCDQWKRREGKRACCPDCKHTIREVQLGVIEFHPIEALRKDFYMVTDDCKAAGQIVDVWLMDLQTILARHGYKLTVTTEMPKPVPSWMKHKS